MPITVQTQQKLSAKCHFSVFTFSASVSSFGAKQQEPLSSLEGLRRMSTMDAVTHNRYFYYGLPHDPQHNNKINPRHHVRQQL
jgi:hypothetical protein